MTERIIITICRQFCSGGMEIGKKLANKLNFNFYDKELLSLAAKESGFTESLFESIDEKPTNSFLYSIAMGNPSISGIFFQNSDFITNDKLFGIQSEVIKNISKKGSSVIVGRCSGYILREEEKVINVYLYADIDFRIKRFLEENKDINPKDAERTLHKLDKKRASYYSYYTGREWDNVSNYDIVLNTSKIGINNSVEQIISYVNYIK